jgi:hypothetical protein
MGFVEQIAEFQRWLDQMLKDAKEKLNMRDETIAWILLREGTAYYFKTISKKKSDPEYP